MVKIKGKCCRCGGYIALEKATKEKNTYWVFYCSCRVDEFTPLWKIIWTRIKSWFYRKFRK